MWAITPIFRWISSGLAGDRDAFEIMRMEKVCGVRRVGVGIMRVGIKRGDKVENGVGVRESFR